MTNLSKELTGLLAARFTFDFQQTEGGSGRGFLNRLSPADPDLIGIAFKNGTPVDFVHPKTKNKQSILGGVLVHASGNAAGAGAEVIEVDLTKVTPRTSDIDGFAVAVVCKQGFSRIAGATCDVEDIGGVVSRQPGAQPVWIDTERFDIRGDNTCYVLSGIVRTNQANNVWELRSLSVGSGAFFWSEVADLVTNKMRVSTLR